MSFVVVDIETTGLSRSRHRITEIAACQVKDKEVTREFHSLVNPKTRIPSFITSLTGIDDDMVKDAPAIADVLPRFVEFLGDDVFVAHNASFDFGFLSHNAAEQEMAISNDRLCTRKLANRLLPELPSKRLDALCSHFDIHNEQHHRALGDARATVAVLNHLRSMLEAKGISKKEELLRFERSAKSRFC